MHKYTNRYLNNQYLISTLESFPCPYCQEILVKNIENNSITFHHPKSRCYFQIILFNNGIGLQLRILLKGNDRWKAQMFSYDLLDQSVLNEYSLADINMANISSTIEQFNLLQFYE